MGTNFYLMTQNKAMAKQYAPYSYELTDEPEFGYEIHIAKTSAGWLPLFQGHKDGINSVAGYKAAYGTGEFKIYDEYGVEYNWEAFDERVLKFNGGKRKLIKIRHHLSMTNHSQIIDQSVILEEVYRVINISLGNQITILSTLKVMNFLAQNFSEKGFS